MVNFRHYVDEILTPSWELTFQIDVFPFTYMKLLNGTIQSPVARLRRLFR
jgi:hypothetical protein